MAATTQTATDTSIEALMNRREFFADFTGHVVGIVDDPAGDLPELVEDLLGAGVPTTDIHLYAGHEGAVALDPTGARHGRLGRIRRALQALVYDGELQHAQRELDAGHAVIGIDADDAHADDIAEFLRRNRPQPRPLRALHVGTPGSSRVTADLVEATPRGHPADVAPA